MVSILKHLSIGDIHGVLADSVVQFLGVKYAYINDRFAPSEVLDHDRNGVIDATKLGPMVNSPPQGCDMEFEFIQCPLPKPDLRMSELDGLNLNVTVPLVYGKLPGKDQKLPVFVFVHGGGFEIGSNSWPQYNQSRLVKISSEMGTPVIGVGINYRVGLPGFLTSVEMREAGYKTNNGLRDQINAFLWIKKYIGGFGGNPADITFIGESAGAVSGHLLMHSGGSLFNRFVSMSGTPLLLQPLPPLVSESAYKSVLEILGFEDLSYPERIKALLSIPIEDLFAKIPPTLPFMPVVDKDLIPEAVTFAQISNLGEDNTLSMPGKNWCKELLIGDCQFDASIFSHYLETRKPGIAKAFHDSITKSLSTQPSAGNSLLQAYNITLDLPDKDALRRILEFATDIGFFAPALTFAKGWPGKVYLYHFNEKNPWEGEWKGDATHVLDVAFLFQNYDEFLSPPMRDVAVMLARDVIKFVNGVAPFAQFERGSEGARVYGPSQDGLCAGFAEAIAGKGSGRGDTILKLGEDIGFDELSAAWTSFLTGN